VGKGLGRVQCSGPGTGSSSDTGPDASSPGEEAGYAGDDALPDSLEDAVRAAAVATGVARGKGVTAAMVELLVPELELLADEGDQERFWRVVRGLGAELGFQMGADRVKVVCSDAGSAALLKSKWTESDLEVASLTDRMPVDGGEDVVLVARPDHTTLEECEKLVAKAEAFNAAKVEEWEAGGGRGEGQAEEEPRGTMVVLFNPKLVSGDVGIGLGNRIMQKRFMPKFTHTYYLSPMGGGAVSVFRKYPGLWQVWRERADMEGRYDLLFEQASRPAGDDLFYRLDEADRRDELVARGEDPDAPENAEPSFMDDLARTLKTNLRFLNSIQK